MAFLLGNENVEEVRTHLHELYPHYDLANKTVTGSVDITHKWYIMYIILYMVGDV